jgi:imidazolonepropionase-like amidohydrolase
VFARSFKIWLPALAALCFVACKPPEESLQKAIIGAVLIDGTGGPPISNSVVIVAGTRIRAIGNRANMPIPAGVEKINGAGKFLVPGLVDLHVHLGTRAGTAYNNADYTRQRIEENLNTYLYFGVTAVRSMGTDRPRSTSAKPSATGNSRPRACSRRAVVLPRPAGIRRRKWAML